MIRIQFFVFIIFTTPLFSQTIKDLDKSDTLYIYFDYGKNQEKKSIKNVKNEIVNEQYFFYFDTKFNYLAFLYSVHTSKKTEVDKSFLKKIQPLILNEDFLRKNNLFELDKLLKQTKKVYLIDIKDYSKSYIVLKEVGVISSVLYDE